MNKQFADRINDLRAEYANDAGMLLTLDQFSGNTGPDCRTCRRFVNPGDPCGSLLVCVRGSRYTPTTPVYQWREE